MKEPSKNSVYLKCEKMKIQALRKLATMTTKEVKFGNQFLKLLQVKYKYKYIQITKERNP